MYEHLKPIFEISFAFLMLILFSPVILIVLIITTIETQKFPIIKQSRMLALGKEALSIYKIRTIRPTPKFNLLEENSTSIFNKGEFKEFVPPFCRGIRKCGFDEIMQLFNVLKGEMALIGPRPLLEKDLNILKHYSPTLHQKRLDLTSKPGITGYWQLWKEEEKDERNLLELDYFYENNKSFLLDLRIFLKTIKIVSSFNHSDAILSKSK